MNNREFFWTIQDHTPLSISNKIHEKIKLMKVNQNRKKENKKCKDENGFLSDKSFLTLLRRLF